MTTGFIPYHGGYKKLRSYQKASIIYDATLYFCDRFFHNNRRQTDQMEQAARSGKQNIAEGSLASATSKQMEIHLTNVARASLGELLEDYEDFLRNHQLPLWDLEHPEVHRLTTLAQQSIEETYELYRYHIEALVPFFPGRPPGSTDRPCCWQCVIVCLSISSSAPLRLCGISL